MKLKDLLSARRDAILKRWFDSILETYPADTATFLKNQKNQFSNPVGAAISDGIVNILDELIDGPDKEKVSAFLDNIVRIRAIQDFSPSRALSFIFSLKKVLREELGKEIIENRLSDDMLVLESKIDSLALLSFDIYMKCREKIYDIKADEVKRSTFRLLQRANLILAPELTSGQE